MIAFNLHFANYIDLPGLYEIHHSSPSVETSEILFYQYINGCLYG